MIAFWSSTDNLNQCISYSRDGGLNWMKYDQNPVLTHAHRDPAVFWHEPSRQWIMVLYGPTPGTENTGVNVVSPEQVPWQEELNPVQMAQIGP